MPVIDRMTCKWAKFLGSGTGFREFNYAGEAREIFSNSVLETGVLRSSIAYAFGREMVCSQKQSEIETSLKLRGMSPFLFVKLVQQRRTQNHAKPAHRIRRSSGQPFTGTTRSAGVWGGWVSDIGRVGKKMVLRRIPIYFLSTIFHDLKPKLASSEGLPVGWLVVFSSVLM